MKKLLFLVVLLALFNSCNKEKEMNLDCNTYKVISKSELKKNEYGKKSVIKIKYYIVFENGHSYSVSKSKYDSIKIGEKIKECNF